MFDITNVQLWSSLGAFVIGIVGVVYQHLQLRATNNDQKAVPLRNYFPIIAMFLCGIIAWTPYLLLKYNKDEKYYAGGSYGYRPPFTFYSTIPTAWLLKYKSTHKLMLIIRFRYANVNRMTDTFIDKSVEYTIDGDDIIMTVVGSLHPILLKFIKIQMI